MRWMIIAPVVANLVVFGHFIESTKSTYVFLNKKITGIESTLFRTATGLSLERCIDKCKMRKKCKFVNFHIYANVCYMLKANTDNANLDVTDSNGFIYAKKSDLNMTITGGLCTDCSTIQTCKLNEHPRCLITGCGIPPVVDNTIVLGNRYGVGSMLKYECEQAFMIQTGLNSQITCLENGSWADTETLIQCTNPIIGCIANWNTNGNSCYLLVSVSQSWNESKKNCESLNAHLVDIESQEEADFLNAQFNDPGVHIGLNDMATEGDFRWSDNSTPTSNNYANYAPNEPNNHNWDNEDCVMLKNTVWSDITCDRPMRSICEYEL